MRLDCRSRYSWEEGIVRELTFLWTNSRDVLYPMDEPNPSYVESLGSNKTCLDSSNRPQGLAPNLGQDIHIQWNFIEPFKLAINPASTSISKKLAGQSTKWVPSSSSLSFAYASPLWDRFFGYRLAELGHFKNLMRFIRRIDFKRHL
jgi:hypothetical protein